MGKEESTGTGGFGGERVSDAESEGLELSDPGIASAPARPCVLVRLGNCTTSLSLGCDCLGAIKYFDAVLNDRRGHPVVVHKAVCMHEEDVGLLWKHVDYRTGHSESRRARRLVISFLTTVVNYEYLVREGGVPRCLGKWDW